MRWVVANIAGGVLGIGVGIAIAQGLLQWVSQSPYFEDTSGFPVGWSFYVALLIATLGGAMGAMIGYAARQRLARQRFVTKNAVWYALAGAVLWPIVGALFVVVLIFVIVLSESLCPNVHGAAFDRLMILLEVVTTVVLALPVGLAVAVLRREEAEW